LLDSFSPYLLSYDYSEVRRVRELITKNHKQKHNNKKRDKKAMAKEYEQK
jgi:hypothetical protein